MVNHGLVAKLTATDLLLLRSFGSCFRTKNSVLHCQQKLTEILLTCRFLTDVMHVQLDNTKHKLNL